MGKKEKIKIVLSAIVMVIALFMIVGMAMYLMIDNDEKVDQITPPGKISGHYVDASFGRYIRYDSQDNNKNEVDQYNRRFLTSYDDYRVFIDNTNYESKLDKSDFNANSYVLIFAENKYCGGGINQIKGIEKDKNGNNNSLLISIGYNISCVECPSNYTLLLVPVEKSQTNENTVVLENYVKENFPEC